MKTSLNTAWRVQSSEVVDESGERLTRPDTAGAVDDTTWIPADLPATLLGALVEAGEIDDPYLGTNLRLLPGQGPPAVSFANHPMPPDSPFRVPWWYRKRFTVPAGAPPYLTLRLDGVNYRADVWLNGRLVADRGRVAGAYRVHELDVTGLVDPGGENTLALAVHAPAPCDLAINWVDWNPSPPDKNMGLWRDVWLDATGPVALRGPHVVTRLADGGRRALLCLGGDLVNLSDRALTALVRADVAGRRVETRVALAPRERRRFDVGPGDTDALVVDDPRLWWPRHLGEPALHPCRVEVLVDGAPSDADAFAFGVREVTSELTPASHTLFRVNGEPIVVRGAGWAPDLLLRRQPERDLAQLEYVKALGLNAIRFEGLLERGEILDWCDREGLLVIAGWCCCDCWEKWDGWNDENHRVAPESLRSQIRRVRRHPSLLTWWYGSDFPPPAHVERAYLEVLAEERWPNPSQSSAANKPTQVTGPSGLKMEGPYEWVPPNYWLEDRKRGGAWGFATEVSPGPAIPPIESLRRMLPADHLWPIDDVWRFHAGGQEFHTVERFVTALEARYGAMDGVEALAEWSQVATYEAQRAMFEAFAARKYQATGVIQWMLNNAWPSLIWHLFDWYLRPGGGFFGTKKACAPLHVLWDGPRRVVMVTSEHAHAIAGLRVEATLYDLELRHLVGGAASVDAPARGRVDALTLDDPRAPGPTFLDLRLVGAGGALVARNFYWLPAEPDELDWEQASWIHTPVKRFADLSALRRLPPARVVARAGLEGDEARLTLANRGDTLAFFVESRLCDPAGRDVLPVLWSDNYVSLLPGESVTLTASPLGAPVRAADLRIEVRGPNVAAQVVAPGGGPPEPLPLDAGAGPARPLSRPRSAWLARTVVAAAAEGEEV
jgi:exo-1,4-beta-D-glucosaminidase